MKKMRKGPFMAENEDQLAEKEDQRPITAYPDSMGPDIHSGGTQEFGVPLPPYVARQGGPGPKPIIGESENPPPQEISEA